MDINTYFSSLDVSDFTSRSNFKELGDVLTRLYSKLTKSYRSLDRAKKEIEEYSRALNNELEKGRQIQRDFLPNEILQIPGWRISNCFYPAKQVSGDFYDVFFEDFFTNVLGTCNFLFFPFFLEVEAFLVVDNEVFAEVLMDLFFEIVEPFFL